MKHYWSHIMRRNGALIAGILAGIAAPGAIGRGVEYPRPQGSDLGRMRGDVQRLGQDFYSVIKRENGKTKSAVKGSAKAKAESAAS